MFLEISQNSQENNCARVSFFIKLQGLWHRCFPGNFAKFLRTTFSQNNSGRLLLFLFYNLVIFKRYFEKESNKNIFLDIYRGDSSPQNCAWICHWDLSRQIKLSRKTFLSGELCKKLTA